jgi:A nuclease family of the HNH/ENDO VII superfamily with conserved AHH
VASFGIAPVAMADAAQGAAQYDYDSPAAFDGHKACTGTCRAGEYQQAPDGEVRRIPGERDPQAVDFTGSHTQADFGAAFEISEDETVRSRPWNCCGGGSTAQPAAPPRGTRLTNPETGVPWKYRNDLRPWQPGVGCTRDYSVGNVSADPNVLLCGPAPGTQVERAAWAEAVGGFGRFVVEEATINRVVRPLRIIRFFATRVTNGVRSAASRRGTLRTNLEKVHGSLPEGYEAHHLIAVEARSAGGARRILARHGIDLNSAVNGVALPGPRVGRVAGQAYHPSIHTKRYYAAVEERLQGAVTRQDVTRALGSIRRDIQEGAFP